MEDNYLIWLRHAMNLEAALKKLPTCECCGKPIQDDYTWKIDDELLCEDCAVRKYRFCTETFILAEGEE